jgi:hypothetical protein
MVQRRAGELGMNVKIGCHTFRATGITAYLEAGGTLENAQAMAAHESPRTTKLYDHRTPALPVCKIFQCVAAQGCIILPAWSRRAATQTGGETPV